MPLIDTHCHLTHGRLAANIPAVIERAAQAGLAAVVCASANLDESAKSQTLANRCRGVYFTAGVHPHDAIKTPQGFADRLASFADDPLFVAFGECGLDYHYDFSPRPVQQRVFAEQLELALRLGRKVIIHTREAFTDTLAIIGNSRIEGGIIVFHSFTEGPENLQAVMDMGAMVSFSGIVTFSGASSLRRAAALVPDDRLLIETDAPYLSPEPVRKVKTNEPAHVPHIAQCLADLRGQTLGHLARLTTENAKRFFGLRETGLALK